MTGTTRPARPPPRFATDPEVRDNGICLFEMRLRGVNRASSRPRFLLFARFCLRLSRTRNHQSPVSSFRDHSPVVSPTPPLSSVIRASRFCYPASSVPARGTHSLPLVPPRRVPFAWRCHCGALLPLHTAVPERLRCIAGSFPQPAPFQRRRLDLPGFWRIHSPYRPRPPTPAGF